MTQLATQAQVSISKPTTKPEVVAGRMAVKIKATGMRAWWISVGSFEEASAVTRAFIESWGLGASTFEGGEIRTTTNKKYSVSYNGRVWDGLSKNWETNKEVAINPDTTEKLTEAYTAYFNTL